MPKISLDEIQRVTQAALEEHGAAPWVAEEVSKAALVIERYNAFGNV